LFSFNYSACKKYLNKKRKMLPFQADDYNHKYGMMKNPARAIAYEE
jgi:hypothetical protein